MRYTEPGPTGTRTLSLHDALPISGAAVDGRIVEHVHADFVEVPGIVGRVLEVPRELTGQLAWNFQYTPNDSWDFDEVGVHMLYDTTINGRARDRKSVV